MTATVPPAGGSTPTTAPAPPRTRAAWRLRLGVVAVVLTAALAALVLLLTAGGAPQPSPAGLPDPGALTGWLLPVVGVLGDLLAVAVVGSLLVPVLTMRTPADELHGVTYRAVAAVRWLAGTWALVVVLEVLLVVSDQLAVPLWQLELPLVRGFLLTSDQGRMLLLQTVLVGMAALGSRWVLTVRESSAILGLALFAIVPPIFTGHSASSGSHDIAIVSLLLHVGSVVVWVGGLIALWWHLHAAPDLRARAARRFAGLAGWCFALTAVSGLVNAAVRVGDLAGFLTSGYGRGALAKLALLALVGLAAVRLRRRVLSGPTSDTRGWRSLGTLAGVELLVLSAAVGLGVALSRTPPPVGEPYVSAAESLLGGPVPPPISVERLLWSFNPSGIGLAVCLLGGALYLAGVLTLRRRGDHWSVGRSVSWFAGLLVVAYATCGGLGVYSHVMFSAHMASHMLLSMIAPILLVLGAPVQLALRALPGADLPGGTGPRQLLSGALRSAPVRVLSHPVVAALLFVSSLYAVYLTSVFDALMRNHLGHAFMELHFLIVGFIFYEVLVGSAPLPRRLPYVGRLGLLLLAMPLHAFFAIAVMSSDSVIGGTYYRLLDRGYASDLLADQHLAGSMTWALSEVPMVIMLLVLLAQWYRSDRRESSRYDRRADRDDDAELSAYNRRLSAMGRTGPLPHRTGGPGLAERNPPS